MKKNIYFEPPSRLQLLDKLKHFIRFSDFLLLVSGDKGTGKSTLLAQLKPDTEDSTLCCCFICPDAGLNEQQLLSLLMQQFPSHEQEGASFADQLNIFHHQLKSIKASGQKCLIAIDDAEHLSEDALVLLLNLHVADAQVLLTSSNSFVEQLFETGGLKHLEGRIHHLKIDPMSAIETAEYLELCHPAVSSLPEKKKNELIRLSEGVPGRVETLLAGGKVSLSSAPAKRSSFPLPALHMLGVGVLLIGIVAVSLWQFLPESAPPAPEVVSDERVSVPLSLAVTASVEGQEADTLAVDEGEGSAIPTDGPENGEVEPPLNENELNEAVVKTDLALRLQQQEAKINSENQIALQEASPSIKAKPSPLEAELRAVVTNNSLAVNEAPKVAKEQSPSASPVIKKTVQSAPAQASPVAKKKVSSSVSSERDLLAWKSSDYTLQMTGARSKQSALAFIAAQSDPSKFYYFETIYKGLPWHVVIYGQYPNRDIANAAIRKLPKSLQNVKPWARSVQGVQLDIRKKKS